MKRTLIRIFSSLFPKVFSSFAYKKLTNPQVRKLRSNELATLNKAKKEIFHFDDFDIQLYKWRGGNQKVLLIHGWEGQAGNFSDIIEALIARNFSVFSFDGPSHGFSSKGKTSLFKFSELVEVLIQKFAVKNLISHSFGGVATTYALFCKREIAIDKYVLLTTPDKFTERIDDVSAMLGINHKVKKLLIQKIEKETKKDTTTLNVSSFVPFINVKQALIIHDKDDRVIPIERSMNVHRNWAASEFIEVSGTGHFRILRTQTVIDKVVHYLT